MVAFWIFGAVNIEELISALSVDEVRSMHFEVPVLCAHLCSHSMCKSSYA